MKNGINKYWRKSSISQIKPAEKAIIRSNLFVPTSESDKQINLQNALSVARIARIDFPSEWPTMFEDVARLIKEASDSQNLIQLSNLLNILNQLVKTFSVTKFGASLRGFQNAAPGIVGLVGEIFVSATDAWVNQARESLGSYSGAMEVGYLALKVVGKVLTNGYTYVHRAPEAVQIFEKIHTYLRGFVMTYSNYPTEMISKHIRTMGKIFTRLLERFPVSFVLLPNSLDVIHVYMSIMQENAVLIQSIGVDFDKLPNGIKTLGLQGNYSDSNIEEVSEFWERVVVQGMKLFKSCIHEFFKKGTPTLRFRKAEDKEDGKRAIEVLQNNLFNPQNIHGMISLLLNNYLKLTPRDLESWKDEPEEWINDERNRSSDFHARPCAETVLVSLLANFKGVVSPLLVEFIQNSSSSTDILLREVAYNVFTLACNAPFENINFNEMLVNVFLPQGYSDTYDSSSNNPTDYGNIIGNQNKLVRRRVCMIISEWVGIDCNGESRVKIYEFLLYCLNPENPLNDRVIMLYACEALRCTIDDWDTDISQFLPFLASFLNRLFPLINNTLQTMEAKKMVLDTICVIISRVKKNIAPFSNLVLQALPVLWEESEDNLIVRGSILNTLSEFIESSGDNSLQAYSISVPMLKVSIDPESPLSSFLFEDALPLWQSMVRNAPEPNADIISLLPGLLSILNNRTENLPIELEILESYILLSPDSVAHVSNELFKTYVSYIPNMNSEEMTLITRTISLLTTLGPLEIIAKNIYESGLIKLLLVYLAADISPITNVNILSIFARMATRDINTFAQMLDATPIPEPETVQNLHRQKTHNSGEASVYGTNNNAEDIEHGKLPTSSLDFVLSQWCSKFDNMGQPRDRKLCVLGTAAVVRAGRSEAVPYLSDLFMLWHQLIEEANETDIGDAEIYYVIDDYTNPNEYLAKTSSGLAVEPDSNELRRELQEEEQSRIPEAQRKRKIWEVDPVHTIPVKPFLKESVVQFQSQSQDHANALGRVDNSVLETLSVSLGI